MGSCVTREEEECISIEAKWRRPKPARSNQAKRSFSQNTREEVVLQEKEGWSVRKSWTENCCAIEVWISKQTGGELETREKGKIHETSSTFCFCCNCLALLHLLFH